MMTTTENNTTPFEKFTALNSPVTTGAVYVVPSGEFAVKTSDGRVVMFGDKGAVDVTDIAEIVNQVETRTQAELMQPRQLFRFEEKLLQCIEDHDAEIKAYDFDTKAIVTISPERLVLMGNVRAIGVVYMPEAAAFGGDVFKALKTLAAASGDRDTLYALRKKEWLAAQLNGVAPVADNLDELLVFAANPGATAFRNMQMAAQQTQTLAVIADALKTLVGKAVHEEQRPTCDCECAPDSDPTPKGFPQPATLTDPILSGDDESGK